MEGTDIGFDAPETDNNGCLLRVPALVAIRVCIKTGNQDEQGEKGLFTWNVRNNAY